MSKQEIVNIYNEALKSCQKPGQYKYKFKTNDGKHVLTATATEVQKADKSILIRKKFEIDGEKITGQALRLILDSTGRENGETPTGRKMARTQASIKAVIDWQKKTGITLTNEFSITEPEREPTSEKIEFSKKELKMMIPKKMLKKALKATSMSKEDRKKVLELYGDKTEMKIKKILKGIRNFQTLTIEEEKAIFNM